MARQSFPGDGAPVNALAGDAEDAAGLVGGFTGLAVGNKVGTIVSTFFAAAFTKSLPFLRELRIEIVRLGRYHRDLRNGQVPPVKVQARGGRGSAVAGAR